MDGTLFPLESNDNCMDSVETPKTVVLHFRKNKSKDKHNRGHTSQTIKKNPKEKGEKLTCFKEKNYTI